MSHFELYLTLIVARWFFGFYKGWHTETMAKMMIKESDELSEGEKTTKVVGFFFAIFYYVSLWFIAGWIKPYLNTMLDR